MTRCLPSVPECTSGFYYASGLCGLFTGAFFASFVIVYTKLAVTGGFDALVLLRYYKLLPRNHLFALRVIITLGVVDIFTVIPFAVGELSFGPSRLIILTFCAVLLSLLFRRPLFCEVFFKAFSRRPPCLEVGFSTGVKFCSTISYRRFFHN